MKRKVITSLIACGLASSMLLGSSTMAFASESSSARFTAKDGVIDEQPGDVFYEIFVRAFRDSDGDSIGDFKGVEEMVPYLADLGITGIWLMPITDSGSAHGYNTRNYYEVNSQYGTMEDFQSLMDTCHKYGIKVVMDLVVNHCGSDNVWFQEALKGPTLEDGSANPYWDYFTFVPSDANFVEKTAAEIHEEEVAYEQEHGSLEGYEKQYPLLDNATYGPENGVWRESEALPGYKYIGIFSGGMPDLNFESEALREDIKNVAKFWLEMGVDGFRLDAARHIFGDFYSNIYSDYIFEQNMDFWKDFRADIISEYPNAYLIGEVWEKNVDNMAPFISEGGLDSTFDFNLAHKIFSAVSNESTAYDPDSASVDNKLSDSDDLNIVSDLISFYNKFGEVSNYHFIDCPFSTNHDQNRIMSLFTYQFDPEAADINTASLLLDENEQPILREDADKAEDHVRVASSLLLTMPGKPFLYYGEEVGLNGAKPDSSIRECMPWYIEPFNEDGTAKEGIANYGDVIYSLGGEASVEAQIEQPDSLYAHYKELIQTRKNIPALMNGDIDEYPIDSQQIVSYIRMTQDQRVLVIVNLSGETITQELTADPNYGSFRKVLYRSSQDSVSELNGSTLTLAPYSMVVLE
ncbi:MAG: alpha-amylase family glycosyl hydrolase [Lachnospiraceae bacterium]|nr:alpha-amylase family glycosyl hydrolase [Robinsoniella sp.]MDY3767758.1 alpha-amylase family glycosyl hydrolase [Lachnospiraceae bacterium]